MSEHPESTDQDETFRREQEALNRAQAEYGEYEAQRQRYLSEMNVEKEKGSPNKEEERNFKKEEGEYNRAKEKFETQQIRALTIANNGSEGFYDLRKEWSYVMKAWISGLIFFNIFVTLFVGFGILDYQRYQWLIMSLTLETFLQIVGMGYIAVKFLFSSQQRDNLP